MPSDSEDLEDISPHIRIRIAPQKKKQWIEYADEHHHGNLTDLIKDAVDNTISDNWILEEKSQAGADLDTSELEEEVSETNARLSVIEQKLDDLSLQSDEPSESELTRDDIIKIANNCHDLLPRVQNDTQLPPLQQALSINIDDIPEEHVQEMQSGAVPETVESIRAQMTGRPDEIADALDESIPHVRQALIFLEQSETGSIVNSVIDQGERRWFVRHHEARSNFDFIKEAESETEDTLDDALDGFPKYNETK